MMNEYANSEAVMYAVRQAENESAKRRKMLAVNPYDGEEVDDSKDKMIIFSYSKVRGPSYVRVFNLGEDAT